MGPWGFAAMRQYLSRPLIPGNSRGQAGPVPRLAPERPVGCSVSDSIPVRMPHAPAAPGMFRI